MELFRINKERGLSYCAGDEELYGEVLQEYYEQGLDYLDKLPQYYAERNWAEYRIIVHAIKGTSLTIGAEKFAEKSKELEQAAAEEKEEILFAECEPYLELFREFLEQISQKNK